MQLFTIGMFKLNMDGMLQLGGNDGERILTYEHDDGDENDI